MATKEFKIDGMSCNHCVMAVKNALKEFNPTELNVEIGKAVVSFDDNKTNEKELAAAIEEEGYKVVN
jgi:copper chaperone CopZ